MKAIIKIGIIIIVLGALTYLGYKVIAKTKYKKEVSEMLQTIPDFSFTTLNQKTYTKENLNTATPIIFIYFNSECHYCQHEAKSIKENIEQFKNVQLLFISEEPIETIKTFAETYKLLENDNVRFLHDKNDIFSTQFDANSIPYLLIYDENQQLIKRHKGQIKAENILKELKPFL